MIIMIIPLPCVAIAEPWFCKSELQYNLTLSCSSRGPTCRTRRSCRPSAPARRPPRSPCPPRSPRGPPSSRCRLASSHQSPDFKEMFKTLVKVVNHLELTGFRVSEIFFSLPSLLAAVLALMKTSINSKEMSKKATYWSVFEYTLSASIFFPVFLLFSVLKFDFLDQFDLERRKTCRGRFSWKYHPCCPSSPPYSPSCCPSMSAVRAFHGPPPPLVQRICGFVGLLLTSPSQTPKHRPGCRKFTTI